MAVGSVPVLVGLFVLGVALVVYSVEVFIDAVGRSAASLGTSGFFLAVVLAGVDLENGVLGITAAVVELPDLALGTVFGESLFVLAVAVGLASLLVPFRMDVPAIYLAMLVLVPLPAVAMSLDGTIGRLEGAVLVALFGPLLTAIYWHERRSETTYLLSEGLEAVVDREGDGETESRSGSGVDAGPTTPVTENGGTAVNADRDERNESRPNRRERTSNTDRTLEFDLDLDEFVPDLEERSGPFALAVAVLAIVGLTVGSLITVFSAEGLFVAFGISGLAFGATVLSFVASIEELALTVEPVRRGQPHLAVGNVVGSTVFYVTANVGIIAVLHPVDTGGAVMAVHWPLFGGCLLVVTAMLARGRVTRFGGAVLVGLYVAYWILNYA